MNYKELLTKVNTEIQASDRAAVRSILVEKKRAGVPASVAWNEIIKGFEKDHAGKNDRSTKNPTKKKSRKIENKAVKPEKHIKDISPALNDDINENKPLTGDVIGGSLSDDIIDGLNMSEIENKIYIALDDFIQLNDIDDMKKAPFRLWRAASRFIGDHVFKHTDILRQKTPIYNGSCCLTTSNSYNYKSVAAVLNFYIYLCDTYNKPITIDSSEMFLGVHDGFLSERREKVTLSGCDLWKKSEASIAAGIIDGKTSPVGALAHLNHYFNWDKSENKPVTASVNVAVYPVLSATAVPVLPDNNNM